MMDADRNADSVEELRSNNARLLAALKALFNATDLNSTDEEMRAIVTEARAAIDDTETRIANDIAEDARYAAELAANRARRMAEYAERVRLGAIENQKREAAALASIGRKPNGEPM